MPELTANQVRAMECEHQFVDVPMISYEVIKSQKRCIHCHTTRLRYADGSIAYQLPLPSNPVIFTADISATGVSVMTCGHEGEE